MDGVLVTGPTVALTGDCMATRGALIGTDPLAGNLRDLLHGADFALTNLEVVPDVGRGAPVLNAAGGGCLIAGPQVVDEIRAAGFSVLSCANNHALDLGTEGLVGTAGILRDSGVPFAGIGEDLTSARRPVYVDGARGSLALVACSSTFLPGQEASFPSPDLRGRPGLNPLHHTLTLHVTAEQMEALRQIDVRTGLRARRAEARALLGIDPALLAPDRSMLFGTRFQAADEPGTTTRCDPGDLEEIARWVSEARNRADVVVVSVHSHEPGLLPEQPAEFLREFARRMIDEGADAVVGHGPHALRGVEIHRGNPIFYSLGNIVSQIELSERVSAEDYARSGNGPVSVPGRHFDALSLHGRRLFAPHPRYWRSMVPVLHFSEGSLSGIRLHPVELGFGLPTHRRGRPRPAGPDLGPEILTEVAALSEPLGTEIVIGDDGVGEVTIGTM